MPGQGELKWRTVTLRQAEVLTGLANNFTIREIAESLRVPYPTVRSTVVAIQSQVGLRSSRELARWWREYRGDWAEEMLRAAGLGSETEDSFEMNSA